MNGESAVRFATERRIHMGLAVRDLERSIGFYRVLLGVEPVKRRPGYAKFEPAEPPVILSLNQVGQGTATWPGNQVQHYGVQVKNTAAVRDAADRLRAAGLDVKIEQEVTCCYAVQDKVWAVDPDGNPWEVYVVLDNEGTSHRSSAGDCCVDDVGAKSEAKADAAEPALAGCGCGAWEA